MVMGLLGNALFIILGLIGAYFSYALDKKCNYVSRINKKLKLGNITSALFYIGIMTLLIFFIPYVCIYLQVIREIPLALTSFVTGFCVYSALGSKRVLK